MSGKRWARPVGGNPPGLLLRNHLSLRTVREEQAAHSSAHPVVLGGCRRGRTVCPNREEILFCCCTHCSARCNCLQHPIPRGRRMVRTRRVVEDESCGGAGPSRRTGDVRGDPPSCRPWLRHVPTHPELVGQAGTPLGSGVDHRGRLPRGGCLVSSGAATRARPVRGPSSAARAGCRSRWGTSARAHSFRDRRHQARAGGRCPHRAALPRLLPDAPRPPADCRDQPATGPGSPPERDRTSLGGDARPAPRCRRSTRSTSPEPVSRSHP